MSIFHAIVKFLSYTTAIGATYVLQTFGLYVHRSGLEISRGGHTFKVAPECSGYRSLIALTLTSLFYVLLFRLKLKHSLIVLFTASFLAVLFNIFRVSVSVLHPGWHDALGYVFFPCALYLTFRLGDYFRPY